MKLKLTKKQKQGIREVIYKRQNSRCLDCDKILTLNQMHCHEKVFRSKGGQMSLENSVGLCYPCHLLGRHKDRRTRFGEKKVLDKLDSI